MSEGKKEIWGIAQPLRADSVFQALAIEQTNFLPNSSTEPGLEALPSGSIKLYGLDAMPIADNNPYHAAASALA